MVERDRRQAAGRAAPAPPRALQAVVPGHGLDAASRGRAPAALGAARLLPAPRRDPARRCSSGSLAELGLPVPLSVALPPPRGPRLRRRLVGARRRAEAVARRRGDRAAARGRAPRGRPAGRPSRRSRRSIGGHGRTWHRPTAQPATGRAGRPPSAAAERRRRRADARRRGRRPAAARAARRRRAPSRPHLLGRLDGAHRVAARRRTGAGPTTRPPTTRSAGSTSPTTRSTRCSPRPRPWRPPERRPPRRAPSATPTSEAAGPSRLTALAARVRRSTELDVELLLVAARARPRRPVRAALRLPQRRRDPAPGDRRAWRCELAGCRRVRGGRGERLGRRGPAGAARAGRGRGAGAAVPVPRPAGAGPGGGAPARRDAPDAALADVLADRPPRSHDRARRHDRRRAVRQGVALRSTCATTGGAAAPPARPAPRCRRPGRRRSCIDLRRLGSPAAHAELAVAAAAREALLAGGVLVAGPVEELADDPAA